MPDITITDVRVVPGDSGFLVDDGENAFLYDTGFAFTGFKLAENIKRVLGKRELDYIFLTHSHYDHAAGAAYVSKIYPGAKIVATEYAQKIFQKSTAKAVMRELDRKHAMRCGVTEYEDLLDTLHADITVSDGDIISCGNMSIETLMLPGHTRCSAGFYLAEHNMLLSSETLGVYFGKNTILPACSSDSVRIRVSSCSSGRHISGTWLPRTIFPIPPLPESTYTAGPATENGTILPPEE